MADAGETKDIDTVQLATTLKYSELSAAAEHAELKAETRYKLFASTSKYVTLAAQSAYTRLSTGLSYINPKVLAQLGEFIIFRAFAEATQLFDQVVRFFGKGLSDTASTTDAAQKSFTTSRSD